MYSSTLVLFNVALAQRSGAEHTPTMAADVPLTPEDALEKDTLAFWDVYGSWAPLSVARVAELMQGFPEPWWVIGGWAIEAFTGIPRPHEDTDISFFPQALPAFRQHLRGQYHLWSNNGGTLRPIDDEQPEPLHPVAQVWIRRNAASPWVLDVPVTPSVDGRWQSKRDREHVAALEEVTWADAHGVRYLAPEITLLHKARVPRSKDRMDLQNTWPLLGDKERAWLRSSLQRLWPDHSWLELIAQA
jgi:hypothetical protein